MASFTRSAALRQMLNAAPSKCLSSKAAPFTQRATSTFSKPAFVRQALFNAPKAAAFHASSRRAILPPLPQKVQGTVNDPAHVPRASPTHGAYHWSFERLISAGLVPLTIAPFIGGSLNPVLDATFCALIIVHSHIGFQSIIIDYIPVQRMPNIRKLIMWALNIGTVLVGIGLYEFETNDVGVTEAVKKLWQA